MRKSHRCAGLGLIPPAVPGAPAGWRGILKAGAQCVGAMPTMNDSSGVLALLAAAVPEGPRDHELMSLHRLSLCIAAGFGMPVPVAGQTVVRALRGADQWEGEPPASLPVYVLYTTGPRCLTDSDELPERKEALRHLAESLALRGCPISEVPESCYSRHWHAGRFLAVVEADAWRAFGLPD